MIALNPSEIWGVFWREIFLLKGGFKAGGGGEGRAGEAY